MITRMLVRSSSRRPRSSFRICAWIVTSSAVVGSSAMISCGSFAIAIAITARWRMPPEKRCGGSLRRRSASAIPTRVSSSAARSRLAAADRAVHAHRLDELRADRVGRVQRRERVLHDHRDGVASQLAQAPLVQADGRGRSRGSRRRPSRWAAAAPARRATASSCRSPTRRRGRRSRPARSSGSRPRRLTPARRRREVDADLAQLERRDVCATALTRSLAVPGGHAGRHPAAGTRTAITIATPGNSSTSATAGGSPARRRASPRATASAAARRGPGTTGPPRPGSRCRRGCSPARAPDRSHWGARAADDRALDAPRQRAAST